MRPAGRLPTTSHAASLSLALLLLLFRSTVAGIRSTAAPPLSPPPSSSTAAAPTDDGAAAALAPPSAADVAPVAARGDAAFPPPLRPRLWFRGGVRGGYTGHNGYAGYNGYAAEAVYPAPLQGHTGPGMDLAAAAYYRRLLPQPRHYGVGGSVASPAYYMRGGAPGGVGDSVRMAAAALPTADLPTAALPTADDSAAAAAAATAAAASYSHQRRPFSSPSVASTTETTVASAMSLLEKAATLHRRGSRKLSHHGRARRLGHHAHHARGQRPLHHGQHARAAAARQLRDQLMGPTETTGKRVGGVEQTRGVSSHAAAAAARATGIDRGAAAQHDTPAAALVELRASRHHHHDDSSASASSSVSSSASSSDGSSLEAQAAGQGGGQAAGQTTSGAEAGVEAGASAEDADEAAEEAAEAASDDDPTATKRFPRFTSTKGKAGTAAADGLRDKGKAGAKTGWTTGSEGLMLYIPTFDDTGKRNDKWWDPPGEVQVHNNLVKFFDGGEPQGITTFTDPASDPYNRLGIPSNFYTWPAPQPGFTNRIPDSGLDRRASGMPAAFSGTMENPRMDGALLPVAGMVFDTTHGTSIQSPFHYPAWIGMPSAISDTGRGHAPATMRIPMNGMAAPIPTGPAHTNVWGAGGGFIELASGARGTVGGRAGGRAGGRVRGQQGVRQGARHGDRHGIDAAGRHGAGAGAAGVHERHYGPFHGTRRRRRHHHRLSSWDDDGAGDDDEAGDEEGRGGDMETMGGRAAPSYDDEGLWPRQPMRRSVPRGHTRGGLPRFAERTQAARRAVAGAAAGAAAGARLAAKAWMNDGVGLNSGTFTTSWGTKAPAFSMEPVHTPYGTRMGFSSPGEIVQHKFQADQALNRFMSKFDPKNQYGGPGSEIGSTAKFMFPKDVKQFDVDYAGEDDTDGGGTVRAKEVVGR